MKPIKILMLRVVLYLGLCVFVSSTWAESATTTNVRALVNVVQACVDRHDTTYPVFHGCIDWHSAVHGHWALLWGAYLLHDKALADSVLKRFDRKGLEQELDLLKSTDRLQGAEFEMPYGRAWFLQLARDAEQFYGFHGLRPLADYIYSTLMDYARLNGGEIAATDYQNASWYLYQLYEWASYSGYEKDRRKLQNLIARRYATPTTWPAIDDNRGFFDPQAMTALLLASSGKPEPEWHRLLQNINTEKLDVIEPPFTPPHRAGLNYSRSWGLLTLARTNKDEQLRIAAYRFRKVMLDSMSYWAHDYRHFGHWIAQFGLFSYRIEFLEKQD